MTATRRRFLAGAAALVVAPSLAVPAGGAVFNPAHVVVTIDGVALRGPISGYMWSFPVPLQAEPGWHEPDPATPWNPHWKREAAFALSR